MSEHEAGIRAAVQEMIEKGYVIEEKGENGETIWIITDSGRDYLAQLQEHEL